MIDPGSPAVLSAYYRLQARFGEAVEPWWVRLPATLEALERQWGITLERPAGRGNTSLVLRCLRRDGMEGILKVTPDQEIAAGEARALAVWRPTGRVPELWAHDDTTGAILMEAIPAEGTVGDRRDRLPLGDVADLIAALHGVRPPDVGGGIVGLSDRVEFMFQRFADSVGKDAAAAEAVPADLVRRGHELARELASAEGPPALLHGDLHPWNVIDGAGRRGLVAIDPRPCVGDPVFDGVDWVFWPHDDPANWRSRCVSLALALGADAERLWAWCRTFAAMLAASTVARGGDRWRFEAFLGLAAER